jgi:SAM-dependent MidA family methyltransferase
MDVTRTVGVVTWQTWREAMTRALYGPDGFYRRPGGPAAHFRTSVHASPLFAEALLNLADSVFQALGQPADFTFVDVGAGRGELLRVAATVEPLQQWRLIGVDVVDRPVDLPDRIEWVRGLEGLEPVTHGVVVANEWLDNIPLDVFQDGRVLEVDDAGNVRPGPPPSERDQQWLGLYGVLPDEPGERTEIGWPRDEAWSAVSAKIQSGLALAIDYTFDGDPPFNDTLTGYRDGRQVPPVPDGSCDLTAHVDLEACGEASGASYFVTDQRTALDALGVSAVVPPRELAATDPRAYLRALARASEARELVDPAGLGRFGWLVQPMGLEPRKAARLLDAMMRPERWPLG